jgi:hypothetical protein
MQRTGNDTPQCYSLVKSALALAGWMQGNRDNHCTAAIHGNAFEKRRRNKTDELTRKVRNKAVL